MAKPLDGVTVVELATFVAAPVCGRLLADLGARVIKVEAARGDNWRGVGSVHCPNRYNKDENPVFDIYNTGKEFVSLNLKAPEGKEAMMKLLSGADVFLTNTRPAALKRLGLDTEEICAKFPGLIYALLLGYGEKGPDADKPAFDSTAFWSKSGFLHDQALRRDDFAPINPPFSMGDTVCGYLLLAEICAALLRKEKTGEGDIVSSGLFHNGIFTTGTMTLINQRPFGKKYPVTRIEHSVPGGMYRCSDDAWVYVGISSAPGKIPDMLAALGHPEVATDPNYLTPEMRVVDKEGIYEICRKAFLTNTSEYWLQKGVEHDFPIVKLNTYGSVYEDEQAWANGYLEKVAFASGNVDIMPTSPIEMKSVGELKTVPAEGVGAHTRRVLAELGYSEEQIEAMMAAGAAK
ncbi:MAG: CoA transferase [Oscillospiraceae bacterium]|nr:CoA transferase [Oscillospiraceae bacterium]